jgi:ribonuclease HI
MIIAYFDGSCEPKNPGGAMGIGAIIYEDGKTLYAYSYGVPAKKENSNNVAEYMAFEAVLGYIQLENISGEQIHIYGDSKLVVQQMNNKWKIKEGRYVEYANRCKELLRELKQTNKINVTWIPRERNSKADELSKSYHLVS